MRSTLFQFPFCMSSSMFVWHNQATPFLTFMFRLFFFSPPESMQKPKAPCVISVAANLLTFAHQLLPSGRVQPAQKREFKDLNPRCPTLQIIELKTWRALLWVFPADCLCVHCGYNVVGRGHGTRSFLLWGEWEDGEAPVAWRGSKRVFTPDDEDSCPCVALPLCTLCYDSEPEDFWNDTIEVLGRRFKVDCPISV